MTSKPVLRAALVLSIFLAACLGIAKAIDSIPAASAADESLDAPQLARQAMAGDDLFTPDFVPLTVDRSDVPWQASGVEDPDHVRSF